MKKYLFLFNIVVVLSLFINSSCKKALKNVDDYLPKVHIVSAVIQADGSVLVTGEIDSKGYSAIEYAGFCCNTSPEPNILNRQVNAEINGTTFTATYKGFNVDSTYYFRSWATNNEGYKYGSETSLGHIIAPPVTPACTLIMNKLNDGSGNGTVNYYSVDAPFYSQYWLFSARPSGSSPLNFIFGSAVTTGIYTVENNSSPSPGNVFVSFNFGGSSKSLESGSKIYVNTIGKDTFDITICNAPWKYNTSTTFTLNTRFTCPY